MCSGIAFFFGLFLLFRGQLIINNRVIPKDRTRLIGLALMAPLVIGLLVGFVIGQSSGVLDFDTLQNAALVELVALIIAFGVVYYLISTTPPSDTVPMPSMRPFAPPTPAQPSVHDILTVPEAAAYLRVSEQEVMRLIDEGKLPAARIGDSFRIARIAIDDFLKEGK
jgi:excisionase family DNA binding protein